MIKSHLNVCRPQQMKRVVLAIFVAFMLFAVYSWFGVKGGFHMNDVTHEPTHEAYTAQGGYVSVNTPQPEAPVERAVIPGGSSTPNQLDVSTPPVIMNEERPYDMEDSVHETADMPERLRHPERMFGPGLQNDSVATAVAAGTASYAQQVTQKAHQVFGPEFAQNGGLFMDGIMANDLSLKNEYSSV